MKSKNIVAISNEILTDLHRDIRNHFGRQVLPLEIRAALQERIERALRAERTGIRHYARQSRKPEET